MAVDVYSIATGSGLLQDAEFSGTIDSLITTTTSIGGMLLLAFIALKFGYEYFKASIPSLNDASQAGRIIDFDEVIRLFVLMVLLALYPALTKSVTGAIRHINDITDKNSEVGKVYTKVMDQYYYKMEIAPLKQRKQEIEAVKQQDLLAGNSQAVSYANHSLNVLNTQIKHKLDQQNGTFSGNNSTQLIPEDQEDDGWLSGINPVKILKQIGVFFINMFTTSIDWAMSAFIRIIYKILLVIGPLAIATSVFWKDKFMGWFEALLNTGLSFTVLNIFSIIKAEYYGKYIDLPSTNLLAISVFNLVIFICYFTVFRLTAMWIGKPLAGSMMGKAVGAVGAVAAVGIMAAGAALAPVTGGASTAVSGTASSAVSSASKTKMD